MQSWFARVLPLGFCELWQPAGTQLSRNHWRYDDHTAWTSRFIQKKDTENKGVVIFLCSSHLRYFNFLHLIVNLQFFMQHLRNTCTRPLWYLQHVLSFLNNELVSQIRNKFILNKCSHKNFLGIYIKIFVYPNVFRYIIFNYFKEKIKFYVYHVQHILKHVYIVEWVSQAY